MDELSISTLAKSAKNEYHNNWQKRNPDKVKKAQEKYWRNKALELLEKQKNNKQDDERSTK